MEKLLIEQAGMKISVVVPGAADTYRGTRFSWAGIISEVTWGEHHLFGPWQPGPLPLDLHDNVGGTAGEFGMGIAGMPPPLGFDEAAPGDRFVKIGAGGLRRPDTQPYQFHGSYELVEAPAWEVSADSRRVDMRQRLEIDGFGYDNTPWVNGATDPAQMYTGGDTVDLQLGTDPKAAKDRAAAVAGDLRISIGPSTLLGGKPVAVLFRAVSATKKPRTFSSNVVKSYTMDFVDVLADAKIEVKTQAGKGYIIEAAIPWTALGVTPAEALALRGDFGVTHGDLSGQRTRLRTFWSNQHTGIVDDAVFELQMEPKNWGDILLQ